MKKILIILSVSSFLMGATTAQSLRGSKKSEKIQNKKADESDLSRIKNDTELARMKKNGRLVHINTKHVKVDNDLKPKYRYVRPWTNVFLSDMGKAFYDSFGVSLQVNSAVRTVLHQKKLCKTNCNAADVSGPRASSHLTGATVDIAKIGLSKIQLKWVRKYLLNMESKKLIEATEEHAQLVFHVMVFKEYGSQKKT